MSAYASYDEPSSRKEPHEIHAKDIVQHVDGEQQAQQHVVERQQLDAMYLAGTLGGMRLQ